MLRRGLLLCIVSIALCRPAVGQGNVEVVSSGPDRLELVFHPIPSSRVSASINGAQYSVFPESETMVGDGPSVSGLPSQSFMIGLPPSGIPSVQLLSAKRTSSESLRLASARAVATNDTAQRSFAQAFDPVRQSSSGPVVRLSSVSRFRDQRIGTITIVPYAYDWTDGSLTTYGDIRITITFPSSSGGVSRDDHHFEDVYRRTLVNYQQSRPWRLARFESSEQARVAGTGTAASPSDWFDPAKRYLKMRIGNDAIYQVTYQDLQSAGITPETVDPSLVALFHNGRSLSIRIVGNADDQFDPNDTLEFFGTRLYDSPRVRNEFSDTSVYWLALDHGDPVRNAFDSVVVATADTSEFFDESIRSEQDVSYYFGDQGLPNNNQTSKVPGEGWYRATIRAGQGTNIPMTLNDMYASGAPNFTARVHVHSSVYDQVTPNHNIEFLANNVLVGSGTLEGYEDKILSFTGPVSMLVNGSNTFRVRSIATGATISDVLFDWLEVTFPRSYRARSDSLLFRPEVIVPGEVVHFELRNFTSDDISVYRLDSLGGIEKMFRGTVTPSGGTFSLAFTDTLTSGRSYLALTGARKRRVSSLVSKTFVSLKNASLGADYLVITVPAFTEEANRLAAYRATKGIGRTYVALMDDIRDEFGFGQADPECIRRFVRMVDSVWTPPSPAYLLLFGDGNWDFKNLLGGNRQNFVPAMGNPVSDALYVSTDTDPYLPTKYVGRIPCRTPAQAAEYVDRIIAYESTNPSLWNKRYMFMAGGWDSVETVRFSGFSDGLANQYVLPSPLAGIPSRFYRTLSLVFTPDDAARAAKVIADGAVWINYYGHGGTEVWGNGIDRPELLRNASGLRHIVSDISCSTVRFAEPMIESFAEEVLFGDEGGGMAFFGSSGFGYESPLRTLAQSLYTQVAGSERVTGRLLLAAKLALWGSGSSSIITRGAMQQYTLLGDPALRIAIPDKPDLAVVTDDISTDPEIPSESDTAVSVRAVLYNFGIQTADSVAVRVHHAGQLADETIVDTKVRSIGSVDTLIISSPKLSEAGVHRLSIRLDPQNDIDEAVESNNDAEYSLIVNSSSILPIMPLTSASLHPDSVAISVQNPGVASQENWLMTVEFDTLPSFAGAGKVRLTGIPQGDAATRVVIAPGTMDDSTLYYWRARFEGAGDSTNWVGSYFTTDASDQNAWEQDRLALYALNDASGLTMSDTIRLDQHTSTIEVLSAGFSDGNRVAMIVDGVELTQGFSNRGYNVAVLDEHTGIMESYGAFSIYSEPGDTTLAEPLIAFLNSIPYGKRVLMAILDEGAVSKSQSLNLAIESFGSAMIRQLTFRGSWALIGWKGAPIGSVPEGRKTSGQGPVTIYDTLSFEAVEGAMTSPPIPVHQVWTTFGAEVDTSAAGAHVSFDVVRQHKSGLVDTVADVVPGQDLRTPTSPQQIVSAHLRVRLSSDSSGMSPFFNGWWVESEAAPELSLHRTSVALEKDSLIRGSDLVVRAAIHNVGAGDADSVRVVTTFRNLSRGTMITDSSLIPSLAALSSANIVSTFPTLEHGGANSISVRIDPSGTVPERYVANNVITISASVLADSVHPTFLVTFDGDRIFDGDYVSSRPTIRIEMSDDNPTPITDPASVTLLLDGQRVTLGSAPDSLFEPGTSGTNASVIFKPALKTGDHTISVQVQDVTGNPADTSAQEIHFRVREEPGFLNVMNFPNPFGSETKFTFNLVGSRPPDELKIRIFTVAGRLVQELRVFASDLRMGFNAVDWDGRDRDGSDVANGIYLYKIVMQVEGRSEEVVEKMARVR